MTVAQQIGKQMVVAVPLPLVVQGDQEHVGVEQPFQQGMAVCAPGDRVAQITAQPVQDRRLQQEMLDLFRLPVEHFFGEVAQNEPVAAAQGGDETGWVGPVSDGQTGKL